MMASPIFWWGQFKDHLSKEYDEKIQAFFKLKYMLKF